MNIHELTSLHAAAVAVGKDAVKQEDLAAYRVALELRMRTERRAAQFLQTCERPMASLTLPNGGPNWRETADLPDDAFEKMLSARVAHRYLPGARKRPPPLGGRVIQTLSGWQTDADGTLTRTLVAEGETPRLEFERYPSPVPA